MIDVKIGFFQLLAPMYEYVHLFSGNTFLSLLKKKNILSKDNQVLDVGGGTGRIAEKIKNMVGEVTVLDASPNMLKQCKRKTRIVCQYGFAEDMPFSNQQFDRILIVDALHHFQHLDDVLKELKRVIKPNGIIMVEEVLPKTMFGKMLKFIENILGMHSTFYTPQALQERFEAYFTSVSCEIDTHSYTLIIKQI